MLTDYEYRYRISGGSFISPIQCNTSNSIDNVDGTITITAVPDENIDAGDFQVRFRAIGINPPSDWLVSNDPFTKQTILIIIQPQPQNVSVGGNISLSVVAQGTNLTYQWYKNNIAIIGATLSTYNKPSTVISDAGSYKVEISNGIETLASDTVMISVTANSVLLNFIGDSITAGIGTTGSTPENTTPPQTGGLYTYPKRTVERLSSTVNTSLKIFGNSGFNVPNTSQTQDIINTFDFDTYPEIICIVFFGANDMNVGSEEDFRAALVNCCNMLRNAGAKVVTVPVLPRNLNQTFEDKRNIFNSWQTSNYETFADSLADYSLAPQVYGFRQVVRPYWFADTLHPADGGAEALSEPVAQAISELLGVELPYKQPISEPSYLVGDEEYFNISQSQDMDDVDNNIYFTNGNSRAVSLQTITGEGYIKSLLLSEAQVIGLSVDDSLTGFSNFEYRMYTYNAEYYVGSTALGIVPENGDWFRIRRTNTNTIIGEILRNGSTEWLQVYDYEVNTSVIIYPKLASAQEGLIAFPIVQR